MRQTARREAPKYSGGGPAYFGLQDTGEEYKLHFTNDIGLIDDEMQLAIVAPDNQEFDMLAPKDYAKKLSLKSPDDLRTYLRKIVDLA